MDESHESHPWPVSVQRLASHLRFLHNALASDAVGTERASALVVYDLGLDEAVTMLELHVVTSRPMGAPMEADQRHGVEQALREAGLDVEGEPQSAGPAGWAGMVAQRLRIWSVLRHEEVARRYFIELADYVESLPGDDWRLESLDHLRSKGQRSSTDGEYDFAIFTGDGVRQVLLNVATAWSPASFDELLAALVIHEAQDLRWRDDL